MTDATAPASIATPDRSPLPVEIGDVFGQARIAFVKHWVIYSGIGMLTHAAISVVSVSHILAITSNYAILISHYWDQILSIIPDSAVLALAYAIICVSVSQQVRGRPFSLGEALGAMLRRSPALIAVALLTSIMMVPGLFLIAPALFVRSLYAVVVPACVVERIGPIKAMSRSAFLTKGNRWRILGFTLVLSLGLSIPLLIIAYLGARTGHTTISSVVGYLVAGIGHGFGAVAETTLYARLRIAREGVDVEQIAAVFD